MVSDGITYVLKCNALSFGGQLIIFLSVVHLAVHVEDAVAVSMTVKMDMRSRPQGGLRVTWI